MSLAPNLYRTAEKFLRKLQRKQAQQIARKLLDLCNDPRPGDSSDMKGQWEGHFRADAGEFRIVYRFDKETLFVDAIGKRNDGEVYRRR